MSPGHLSSGIEGLFLDTTPSRHARRQYRKHVVEAQNGSQKQLEKLISYQRADTKR